MLYAQYALPQRIWQDARRILDDDLKDICFNRFDAPFLTYGLPAYQTCLANPEYSLQARRCSPRLLCALPLLYREITQTLEHLFRKPVRYHYQLAVPGFHYFPTSSLIDYRGGGIHSDLSFSRASWEFQSLYPQTHWSVLTVISAPNGCANLDFFDASANPQNNYFPSSSAFEGRPPMETVNLATGTVSIFNGYQMHRIGCYPEPSGDAPNHPRVTLQGHLYPVNGELIFYW